mmetsp:Transcript_39418/g.83994  ORF Transcript_39418/g.83994 Transcript_39418/m.83994 type:complete len:221 (+) Transcript_39418:44-706(+)
MRWFNIGIRGKTVDHGLLILKCRSCRALPSRYYYHFPRYAGGRKTQRVTPTKAVIQGNAGAGKGQHKVALAPETTKAARGRRCALHSPIVAVAKVGVRLLCGGVCFQAPLVYLDIVEMLLGRLKERVDDLLALLRRIRFWILVVAGAQPCLIAANLHGWDPLLLAPQVGVSQRVRAAAVLLLVEPLLRVDAILALRHLLSLPVVLPVERTEAKLRSGVQP